MLNELFSNILDKFIANSPVSVMAQGLVENLLNANKLNQWFNENCGTQYTRDLNFSSVVAVMLEVVCQIRSSIHVSYQKSNHINVSITSLYNKLNGMEPNTSASLVRDIALESSVIIQQMKAENNDWIKGYRIKLLDGNCIEATEHRIKVLRDTKAGALPGKSLVVFDPKIDLAIDVFPCEDGHAQERSLLSKVLMTMERDDCWVADRNFCTQHFLFGIHQKKATFVIRQHEQIPIEILEEKQFIGLTDTGKVYEQAVSLKSPEGKSYIARRITVKLNKKTRNGDNDIHILTNLPIGVADARLVAETYRKRWGIETAFQRLEAHFNSEINSLGYPKAALFGFCMALVAFNICAIIMASLRAAYPKINIKEEVSEYYISDDISTVNQGMMIAVNNDDWIVFRDANPAQIALLLIYLARQVDLKKFKKHKRGIKKSKTKIKYDKKTPHVSTFKMLL